MALGCVLALGTTGCFLPLHVTEPASPALVGFVTRSDGTPAAGTRVAVTSEWSDRTCRHAAERTTTDSAGVFRLRATTLERHWIMIIPPVERFFNAYLLCAGDADSALVAARRGIVPLGYARRWAGDTTGWAADTVRCLEWTWQRRERFACGDPRDTAGAVQIGGRWTDGDASGFYRLIVVGTRTDAPDPGVYLQWVQRPATGPPDVVRETVALPMAPRLLEIEVARLEARWAGSTCVVVRSRGWPRHWYSWGPTIERVSLELGPPGEMHAGRACP